MSVTVTRLKYLLKITASQEDEKREKTHKEKTLEYTVRVTTGTKYITCDKEVQAHKGHH